MLAGSTVVIGAGNGRRPEQVPGQGIDKCVNGFVHHIAVFLKLGHKIKKRDVDVIEEFFKGYSCPLSALLLDSCHKKQVSVDSENFLLHFSNDFKV